MTQTAQNEQIENSGKTTNATLPFKVSGAVSLGDKRGHLLGFPTANLVSAQIVGLAYGVYASTTRITGRSPKEFASVTSYGTRPTFEGEEARIETHIFDFDGDIYGEVIDVCLTDFVRCELRFETEEDLVKAMTQDVSVVRSLISHKNEYNSEENWTCRPSLSLS